MVSSNSKVFLTEDIEGMDGKGEGDLVKVMRNIFKLMMLKSKALLPISSPLRSTLVQMHIFTKCLLHIMHLLRQRSLKGCLN